MAKLGDIPVTISMVRGLKADTTFHFQPCEICEGLQDYVAAGYSGPCMLCNGCGVTLWVTVPHVERGEDGNPARETEDGKK